MNCSCQPYFLLHIHLSKCRSTSHLSTCTDYSAVLFSRFPHPALEWIHNTRNDSVLHLNVRRHIWEKYKTAEGLKCYYVKQNYETVTYQPCVVITVIKLRYKKKKKQYNITIIDFWCILWMCMVIHGLISSLCSLWISSIIFMLYKIKV